MILDHPRISASGYSFRHYGDEMLWLWPWRRRPRWTGPAWISWGFDGVFPSLAAICELWDEYDAHERDRAA